MEMHKSKSLNFLAPSLQVSEVDLSEPSTNPINDSDNDTNEPGDATSAKSDMSIKSAIEVSAPQERRLSGSLLGDNLNLNKSMGHLNLKDSKQYILGTTRVNVRTSGGPAVRPVKPERGPETTTSAADAYNAEKVLESARTALELMEALNKCKENEESNMGMFCKRTTGAAESGQKSGRIVGSLVQRFEKTDETNSSSKQSEVETPIYV